MQYPVSFSDLADSNFIGGSVEELVGNDNENCDSEDSSRIDQWVMYSLLRCLLSFSLNTLLCLSWWWGQRTEVRSCQVGQNR